jgi:pSer/pThr/pTyr-binding forkhead associated (FHA) protein
MTTPRDRVGWTGALRGSAWLVVKRGPNAGSRFLLDQTATTVGRHPNSDIFLDGITVSRRHAQFRCISGKFEFVDVDSLNGTYVNREPVKSAALANGDEVQIGKFRLVFLTGPTTGDTESVTGERVTCTSTKPEVGSSDHPNRLRDVLKDPDQQCLRC